MSTTTVILVLSTGVLAGFLNTLAGGGSILTLPMLIFLGLPSAVANGTNRVAILLQNITAVLTFRKGGVFFLSQSLLLSLPAVLGSLLGARIAIDIPDLLFNRILAVTMIMILGLVIWKPRKPETDEKKELNLPKAMLIFFFVGLYGGFIQVGVGIMIMVILTLISGYSLAQIAAIKVFVIGMFIISSLIVFIRSGNVDWVLGLTLSVGNMFGAWLGGVLTLRVGDGLVRAVLVIAALLMAGNLLISG